MVAQKCGGNVPLLENFSCAVMPRCCLIEVKVTLLISDPCRNYLFQLKIFLCAGPGEPDHVRVKDWPAQGRVSSLLQASNRQHKTTFPTLSETCRFVYKKNTMIGPPFFTFRASDKVIDVSKVIKKNAAKFLFFRLCLSMSFSFHRKKQEILFIEAASARASIFVFQKFHHGIRRSAIV